MKNTPEGVSEDDPPDASLSLIPDRSLVLLRVDAEQALPVKIKAIHHLLQTMGKNGLYLALHETSGFLYPRFMRGVLRPVRLGFFDFNPPSQGVPMEPKDTRFVPATASLSEISNLLSKAIEVCGYEFVFLDSVQALLLDKPREEGERFLAYLIEKCGLFSVITCLVVERDFDTDRILSSARRKSLPIAEW